ncbi:MAG: SRPBCC domain-containing protein [Cyclobacteriaceae bacterium]
MEHIRHHLIINAPINEIYTAVTTQEGLSQWWTNTTVAKPEIGFVNEFRFGPGELKMMKVLALDSNKSVDWQCVGGDEEWQDTQVSFDLQEIDGKTHLRFIHRDWKEATVYYETCNFHWGLFLQSLRMLCETGKGNPFQDML